MGLATMTKPNQRDTEVRSGFQSSTSDSMYLTLNPYHLTVLFTTLNNSPRVLLFFFFFFWVLLFWWSLWQKVKDTIPGGMLLKPQSPASLCSQGLEGGSFGVQGRCVIMWGLAYLVDRMNLLPSQVRGKWLNHFFLSLSLCCFICAQKGDERSTLFLLS